MVGNYREIYGRTNYSYPHTGYRHTDELGTTALIKVGQHEALAAPVVYGSNRLSGPSAKVITYHKDYGEDGRLVLSATRVMGAARMLLAANEMNCSVGTVKSRLNRARCQLERGR